MFVGVSDRLGNLGEQIGIEIGDRPKTKLRRIPIPCFGLAEIKVFRYSKKCSRASKKCKNPDIIFLKFQSFQKERKKIGSLYFDTSAVRLLVSGLELIGSDKSVRLQITKSFFSKNTKQYKPLYVFSNLQR